MGGVGVCFVFDLVGGFDVVNLLCVLVIYGMFF